MPLPTSPLVSTSTFHFLYTAVVNYYLHGHGTRYFQPSGENIPPADTIPDDVRFLRRQRISNLASDIGMRYVQTLNPPPVPSIANSRTNEDIPATFDLDMVKFICKNFWESLFNKQIDILRTNHKGLYVLTDNNFQWIESISPEGEMVVEGERAGGMGGWEAREDFVVFPCGLIQGALQGLGINSKVTAEIAGVTTTKVLFNVQIIS